MDTDKVKVFGARFKVDGTGKLAELERAERVRLSHIFTLFPVLTVPSPSSATGKNESQS